MTSTVVASERILDYWVFVVFWLYSMCKKNHTFHNVAEAAKKRKTSTIIQMGYQSI